MPRGVRKRDGKVAAFDLARIAAAVSNAAGEVGENEPGLVASVTAAVSAQLTRRFTRHVPSVEDVQDAVEQALMAAGRTDVARAYVVYRRRHAELRRAKQQLGVSDELKLGLVAVAVLKERYLRRITPGMSSSRLVR
jgi:ribonucleoside-diphosphate reductase alpha chain